MGHQVFRNVFNYLPVINTSNGRTVHLTASIVLVQNPKYFGIFLTKLQDLLQIVRRGHKTIITNRNLGYVQVSYDTNYDPISTNPTHGVVLCYETCRSNSQEASFHFCSIRLRFHCYSRPLSHTLSHFDHSHSSFYQSRFVLYIRFCYILFQLFIDLL